GAQVGATELMEKRLPALLDDGRLDSLVELGDELFARAEGAMRTAIREVPDGTYRYAMRTDGVDEPLDYRVALTIAGDEITADFTGTSLASCRCKASERSLRVTAWPCTPARATAGATTATRR